MSVQITNDHVADFIAGMDPKWRFGYLLLGSVAIPRTRPTATIFIFQSSIVNKKAVVEFMIVDVSRLSSTVSRLIIT